MVATLPFQLQKTLAEVAGARPKAQCCSGEPRSQIYAPAVPQAGIGVVCPQLSVIVAVYNCAPELQQCMEALRGSGEGGELIVVDDQSKVNIRDIVERYGARYFCMPRHGGPAAARNLGAQHATGDILVFVDADVIVAPDALRVIREEFENNPELTALFGSYDDDPACTDFCSSFKNLLHHHVHQVSSPDAVTFWTGCGAIRKRAFQTAGGFDATRYRNASIEDIELGIRLIQQQQKIRLVKRLRVKHLKKWTLGSMVRTDIFRRAIPWTQLILRTRSMPRDLNLTLASRVSAVLVAAAAVLTAGAVSNLIRPSGWSPRVLASGLFASIMLLLCLNRELYRFFWRKRGTIFVARAVLVHWFYLFYSGSVFTFCCAAEILQAPFRSAAADPKSHVGTSSS